MIKINMFVCPKCHFEFPQPELPDGRVPRPTDEVACPECKEVSLALIYEGFEPQEMPNGSDSPLDDQQTVFNIGLPDED